MLGVVRGGGGLWGRTQPHCEILVTVVNRLKKQTTKTWCWEETWPPNSIATLLLRIAQFANGTAQLFQRCTVRCSGVWRPTLVLSVLMASCTMLPDITSFSRSRSLFSCWYVDTSAFFARRIVSWYNSHCCSSCLLTEVRELSRESIRYKMQLFHDSKKCYYDTKRCCVTINRDDELQNAIWIQPQTYTLVYFYLLIYLNICRRLMVHITME